MTGQTAFQQRNDNAVPPLLELRNVTKVFRSGGFRQQREVVALNDFSLTIDGGTPGIIAVVGESGSGKSTMANLLLGFETPTSGQAIYRGNDLRDASRQEQRAFRRDIQAVFQDPFGAYNSFYKVDHVLTTPIAKFKLAKSRGESRRLIDGALRAVGLRPEDTLGRFPHQLSGGQRQRVMVARTLLLRPKLIIADEPVSMVDASLRLTVLRNLLQLKEQFGISIIYITHDLATAYQISDRIVVLHRGLVVEEGHPEQVVKQPNHDYTRLLINSIPSPDPAHGWGDPTTGDEQTPARPAGTAGNRPATANEG